MGQPAGDAAQAVRRAGLRPGLDRSFGCAEELTGLVVEQEPTAGSDLARNGMVTLYVAAPGNEPVDGDTDTAGLDSDAPPPASPAPVQVDVATSEGPTTPARARRRKPGHARRAAPAFDPPPAPAFPDPDSEAQPPTVPLAQPAVEQSWNWSPETFEQDGEQLADDTSDELDEPEFTHDEFVVHLDEVDDVLAGRAGPALWRRVYPRRRTIERRSDGHGARAWLGQHRLAAGAVGAALAAWAVVGVGSALDGHHTHTPTASASVVSKRPTGTHRAAAAKPAPALSSKRYTRRPDPRRLRALSHVHGTARRSGIGQHRHSSEKRSRLPSCQPKKWPCRRRPRRLRPVRARRRRQRRNRHKGACSPRELANQHKGGEASDGAHVQMGRRP